MSAAVGIHSAVMRHVSAVVVIHSRGRRVGRVSVTRLCHASGCVDGGT